MEKKGSGALALQKELARIQTQVEVQNRHLTSQKQLIEQLKGELGSAKQALAEVSQSDLAKKTMLLQTELD